MPLVLVANPLLTRGFEVAWAGYVPTRTAVKPSAGATYRGWSQTSADPG